MLTAPVARTLPALLREQALRLPQHEALVAGTDRYSYARLAAEVQAFANGLHRLGVTPGDKVAILMGNRAEWIVAALAITHVGGIAVALNTWWTARELEYALAHSDSRLLICPRRYLRHDYGEIVEDIRRRGAAPQLQAVIGIGEALPAGWLRYEDVAAPGEPARDVPIEADPEATAYILYTSGSTSHPKGVMLVHRDLVENMWEIGARQRLDENDRLWLAVSLFWGYGCANALLTLLTHGGCLVLQESFDAAQALALIEAERCTVLYGTPNMVQALLEHPDAATRDLSSLRTGTTLGTPEQLRRAVTLGATQICNIYGMTETYGNSHVSDAHDPLELRLTCCGHPLPGFAHRIVDPESGRELAAGQIGEICLRGRITPGYYKDAQTTAKCFDADGWFRTSDLGLIDADGRLHFRGRLKEIVKTGGINVSPAEIEHVLMAHPDVHLAIVIGIAHPTRDEILAAVVVPRPGRTPTEADLIEHCRDQLAVYKVPKLLCFASESALPLTTTGKVQKNRLAESFFAPAAGAPVPA